jgi:hypothetical protein
VNSLVSREFEQLSALSFSQQNLATHLGILHRASTLQRISIAETEWRNHYGLILLIVSLQLNEQEKRDIVALMPQLYKNKRVLMPKKKRPQPKRKTKKRRGYPIDKPISLSSRTQSAASDSMGELGNRR